MPRLNIEDTLFTDPRYLNLIVKLGSPSMALGSLLYLWKLAEKHRKLAGIPKEEFLRLENSEALLACQWVEDKQDLFYAKGSANAFQWLENNAESGRKGGKSKANKAKASETKRKLAKPSEGKPLSLSLSLSHTHTPDHAHTYIPTDPKIGDLVSVWFDYSDRSEPFRKYDINKFQKGVLAILKTGLNIDQLKALFEWARNDDFWKDKIYSPERLLSTSKNGDKKLNNLLTAFARPYKSKAQEIEAMENWDKIDLPF